MPKISDLFQPGIQDCKPNLGCATTKELMQELQARAGYSSVMDEEYPISARQLEGELARMADVFSDKVLNYRTVDQ